MSNEHELLILGEESLAVNPRRLVFTDCRCLRPPHGVPIKELHVPLKKRTCVDLQQLEARKRVGKNSKRYVNHVEKR